MKKYFINTACLFVAIAFFTLSACKKENTEAPNGNLILHVHSNVGNSVANYSATYTDATGRKFNVSDWRYYVSNVVLIKADGSEYPIANKVLIVDPATSNYNLGQVPAGNYLGYRFYIGLDSATNHLDPTTYAAGDPLAIQTPALHWSWNAGYIFMKIEGRYDSTVAGTGTPNHDYLYHIGMDMLRKTIDFSTEGFTVHGGSDNTLTMACDLQKVLGNVDMVTENATHTMDDMPLAMKIANNWSTAFEAQ